jgi:mono/diheme cytochrome c family protein
MLIVRWPLRYLAYPAVFCSVLWASAAQAAEPLAGKALFEKFCAECHAAGHGHPGTQRLAWSRGEKLAVLEKRKDLSAEYIRAIVRNGLLEMPPYRPTEITDAELVQLSQYLAPRKK